MRIPSLYDLLHQIDVNDAAAIMQPDYTDSIELPTVQNGIPTFAEYVVDAFRVDNTIKVKVYQAREGGRDHLSVYDEVLTHPIDIRDAVNNMISTLYQESQ